MAVLCQITSITCLLACLTYGAQSHADYKIGTLDYPPYTCQRAGRIQGVATALVQQLLLQAKLDAQMQLMPWKRVLASARVGTVDAIYPALKTTEREKYLIYLDQPLWVESVVLVRLDEGPSLGGDLSKLAGKSVCTALGFSLGSKFDNAFNQYGINKIEQPTSTSCMRLLMQGLVEFYATDLLTAQNQQSKATYRNWVTIDPHAIDETPSYLAVSRRSPLAQKMALLNQQMNQLHLSGNKNRLAQQALNECD
ncbi:transporter substrate-binding domain-containing protein [Chitinivorax sp. B]|uniref:substrate-binding periplasmic protein n=1 Tax=Chitinivorax sp. B TaxID=2502235 RepID=UPI0010F9D033|nr:transporter substrate-binding domain-containing protein [Chitinivorax sp. B]